MAIAKRTTGTSGAAPKPAPSDGGDEISSRPSKAEAGGLLSDVRCKVVKAAAVMWNYGNRDVYSPFLLLKIRPKDADEDHDLYMSAGNPARIVAREDGEKFVRAEGSMAQGLPTSSNAYVFLASATNAGFPEEKLDEGFSILEGLDFHLLRIPQPKRPGLPPAEEGEGRERTVPTVSEIYALPWEEAKEEKPKSTKAAPATAPASEGHSDNGIVEKAQAVILDLLDSADYKKGIPKDKLYSAVFNTVKTDKDRRKIMDAIQEKNFLESGPWNFEDEVITSA